MRIVNFIKEKIDLIRYISLKITLMITSFILNLFLVKKLTGYDYGIYTLTLTVLGFLITFGFGWSASSLMYFGVEEKLKYGSLNRTFWARNIILIISYIFISFVFLFFHKRIDNYLTENISIYIFIWMSIKIFTDYLSAYFLAIEKRITSILGPLTVKILILLFVYFLPISLKKILIYSVIAELFGLLWIVKINKRDFGKFIFDKPIFKQVFSFGIWQLFGYSGIYLVNFGDNLVIKYFLTVRDVGIYNISYQLFGGIAGFSYLFSSYFAPKVVKAVREKNLITLDGIYKKDRIFLIILVCIPHLFVLFLAKKIILKFYGVTYIQATLPLIVLIFVSLLKYFTSFNSITYNCFKKYSILQVLNILQALLNIIFDIILVPKFGILGAAYGTFLSYFTISIFETVYGEYVLRKFREEITK